MLSSFLKRLLLARQFSMQNGRINILGAEKIMLPQTLILKLEENDKYFNLVKESIIEQLSIYSKNLGTNEKGILNVCEEIFESFGVGVLNVISHEENETILIIKNPISLKLEENKTAFAIVEGLFSFIYDSCVKSKYEIKKNEIIVKIKRG
ncbi:MAG: hypothetical protein ACLFPJ_06415 [Candidatus Woesearchaeota archaeon]